MGEPESGCGSAFRVLQLLPYSLLIADHSGYAGGYFESCLEFRGIATIGLAEVNLRRQEKPDGVGHLVS